jgi:hypothetical protein
MAAAVNQGNLGLLQHLAAAMSTAAVAGRCRSHKYPRACIGRFARVISVAGREQVVAGARKLRIT